MLRRDFGKASLSMVVASALGSFSERATAANSPCNNNFPKIAGLTDYVAKFVTNTKYADIPESVLDLGKKSILDGLGLALAGSKADTGDISRQYIESFGNSYKGAIVIGSGIRTAPRFAAFVNGISIHADDFDDTQLSAAKDRVYGLLVHPTVPVLPAVLALSARAGVSGKDFLSAYHVGVEVECKVAEAISPRHYQDGFHSTGTCGAFGSVAASAKLLRLDLQGTLNAFGIAASESGGASRELWNDDKAFSSRTSSRKWSGSSRIGGIGLDGSKEHTRGRTRIFPRCGGFIRSGGNY